jgi:hypothetical protein
MPKSFLALPSWLCRFGTIGLLSLAAAAGASAAPNELNVLFIGNSFTARHSLAKVIKTLAEEGQPGLSFQYQSVIYGGRTLANHWELQTPNFIRQAPISPQEVGASIDLLRREIARRQETEPAGKAPPSAQNARSHFVAALRNQEQLAASLHSSRRKWDIVVLQSYLDDLDPEGRSSFFDYAPRYAALARAEGARVILYETTQNTQNATALTAPPDPAAVLAKARQLAALAARIGAEVVPMSLVALRCQTARPDLTLRFVNDSHLNQTMAYLTACTFYGRLFNRSPEGLVLDQVTDNRFDAQQKDRDRDGGPLTRIFSARDRADLQRIAWLGLNTFADFERQPR